MSAALLALPAQAAVGLEAADGLTAPSATLFLGGEMWVADHIQGICRMVDADGEGPGLLSIDVGSCNLTAVAPGQVSSGEFNGQTFVFVPDLSSVSQGVWRLEFVKDPVTGQGSLQNPVLMAPAANLGPDRPTATVVGSDGKLYVGSRTADIVRFSDPAGDVSQFEVFAQTVSGGGVQSLTVAKDATGLADALYILEIGVSRVSLAGGTAEMVPNLPIGEAMAIGSDRNNTLYVADSPSMFSELVRYTISTGVVDLYANVGVEPDAILAENVITEPFQWASSVAVDAQGNIWMGDDPADGGVEGQGHLWKLSPNLDPVLAGTLVGQPPLAMKAALPRAFGVTYPTGYIFMGTTQWVADHLMGVCRLDPNPLQPGTLAINPTTCFIQDSSFDPRVRATGPVAAGQPAYDPATRFLYVPDLSSKSSGVWRARFDPVSRTLTEAMLLPATKPTGRRARPGDIRFFTAALGPDGALYLTNRETPNIWRIADPAGAGITVNKDWGRARGALGVLAGTTFLGSDLYLAEGTEVTRVGPTGGTAQQTNIAVTAPTAITSAVTPDGTQALWIADTARFSNILRFQLNPAMRDLYVNTGLLPDGNTELLQMVATLSIQPGTTTLLIGSDPTGGDGAGMGTMWYVTNALQDDYCYNGSGKEGLCRGNGLPKTNGR